MNNQQETKLVTTSACEVSQENHKKYVRQNMKPKKVHDLHEVVLSPYVQRSTSPDQKTMEVQKRAVEPYIASASSSAYTIQDLPQCAENRGARSIKQGHLKHLDRPSSKRDETVRQPKQRLRKVGPFAIGSISSSDGRIRYAGSWAPSSKDDTDGEDAYTESHVNSDKPSASRVGDECICERCSECGAIKEEYTDEEMVFCYNKKVCGKCGEKHQDEQCQAVENKCLLCGGAPHETRSCPKYRERSNKLELELKRRSKRSFAEIVKSAAATTTNENLFAVLSDEEPEHESSGEELTFRSGEGARKNKEKPRKQLGKTGKVSKDTTLPADKEDFIRAFPSAGSKKNHQETAKLKVPLPQKDACKTTRIRIPFSTIVELVLSTMSEPTRAMVEPLVPFLRAIGKHYAENSTILEFISVDS
ncbi:hypothetical protein pipiens_013410 [Culex pipiens pipiens]|uniref:Uncharacterized protein n=1 Tax=Culex pipiens pipiens TaxID=38569 RepID=A0ABD1CZ13_CULPP